MTSYPLDNNQNANKKRFTIIMQQSTVKALCVSVIIFTWCFFAELWLYIFKTEQQPLLSIRSATFFIQRNPPV